MKKYRFVDVATTQGVQRWLDCSECGMWPSFSAHDNADGRDGGQISCYQREAARYESRFDPDEKHD